MNLKVFTFQRQELVEVDERTSGEHSSAEFIGPLLQNSLALYWRVESQLGQQLKKESRYVWKASFPDISQNCSSLCWAINCNVGLPPASKNSKARAPCHSKGCTHTHTCRNAYKSEVLAAALDAYCTTKNETAWHLCKFISKQVRHGDQQRYPHVLWPLRWTIAHSTWMVPLH